eukprot:Protomagalhaensia_sp_Gyna_25__664@NODE_130_length_5012_cov_64_347879_g102_i0_p4_GENE_NODE_130_length_5012_cov_64_347879_g102_i0NODE_130_length_5012_cov_64_347879_g102_i0_p4_ORF_typecomplete_len189_score13_19RRM_1/PF00076_22/5_5e14RRM_1/PF00076_22/2_4e03RRM_7/PF16367_5/3e06RRM_7/PF16367_5/4_2e02RRM_5/PF13893_6/3_4e06Nup35_RRM_2/PF14605_6/9_2e06RL/PF17797_1/0_0057RRM_3/PF08777_11/0_017_NODE_130_length_5012_cov_64_347879_g102_i029653531
MVEHEQVPIEPSEEPKEEEPESEAGPLASGSRVRKEAKKKLQSTEGVLKITGLPHYLLEDDLVKYFKQFGEVQRCSVQRSARTGGSKGYAYVQFADDSTAKTVAEGIPRYLAFGKTFRLTHRTDLSAERVARAFSRVGKHVYTRPKGRLANEAGAKLAAKEKSEVLARKRERLCGKFREMGLELPPAN